MSELSVKIQKEDDVRRVNLKSTRFSDLLETISTLFAIRADQFKICYLDEDKDSITVTTDLELKEALTLAKKTNTILRLLIKESKGNKSAPSPLPQPKVETSQSVVKSSLQPTTMEFSTATGTETVIKSITSLANESINTFEQATKPIVQDSQKKVDEQPYAHEALCDSCKSKITGIRYKCGNCDDFDLCERCEGLKSHNSEHVFLKLYKNISPVPKALLPLLYVPKAEPQKPKEEEPIILVANFVKDVSIEDGTVFKKAEKFRKIWRLRNDGKTAWIPGCRLVMTEGCSLGVVNFVEVPSVKPGEEIDISVDLVAPNQPGRYVSYWRLTTNNGIRFGHRIWVDICVAEDKPEPVIPQPIISIPSQPMISIPSQPIAQPVIPIQPIAQPVTPVQPISQPVAPVQPISQPVTPVQPISQPVAPSQLEITQISETSDLSGPAFQVKVSEKSLKIKNGNELVDVEFIITKDNELVFRTTATKEVRLRHSLTHLKRWAVVENAITLDFAEWESGFITLQTPIASQIGSLISNRIESILEQAVPQMPPSPVKEVPKVVEVKEPLPHGVTESEMEKLAELGFNDRKKNATLLLKHKGDIVKVVTELVE